MKYLTILLLMFCVNIAHAELTKEQQIAIEQILTNTRDSKPEPPSVQPEDVQKWISLGSNIGAGLAASAKELGVAASEFANTGTGKLVVWIIVWKTIGSSIAHILAGILILFTGLLSVIIMMNKRRRIEIKYDKERTNIFGNYPIISTIKDEIEGEFIGGMCVYIGMVIVISMICLLNA